MRIFFLALTLVIFVFAPNQQAIAQSPEMPVPLLVLKDADGKVIAQIADSFHRESNQSPRILLNIDGVLALFVIYLEKGVIADYGNVHFSNPGCSGDVYIPPPSDDNWWEASSKTRICVVGPDPDTGTYRMFRTTSPDSSSQYPLSEWVGDRCVSLSGGLQGLAPAEEILPNPLEGFHGPTTANPERGFTVAGGTRLP